MTDYPKSQKAAAWPLGNEPPPHTDDDYIFTDLGLNQPPPYPLDDVSHVKREDRKTADEKTNEGDSSADINRILTQIFHFKSFRPYQEKVCRSAVRGKDILLVMPTGSGKSLCYQVPGITRKGTTLVVTPLIALMEDQTTSLKKLGLAAERIHSGRDRLSSRRVCGDYLNGKLDFLFIAPERLGVPGFPEMLVKRKPTLIAIDEAHCISQWGHDFRPDYRLLGERLPALRPAPVIAMTATATPRVQKDIIRQLGLKKAEMHIHGFRRTNIAIELVELPPSERNGKVLALLENKEFRPSIIYAPTRQKAETLALALKEVLPAAAYHAGLSAALRDQVQGAFLSGKLEAIVATIAFGMGIDKPDIRSVIHTAMPGSLEGYYQEIGRAGRDGKPARAILLHSYGDRRVHLFFHEKSYPPETVLKQIHSRLAADKIPAEKLRQTLGMEPEPFEIALQKLWIHGGALVYPDETVSRGKEKWRPSYQQQSDHRLAQIDAMARFSNSFSCRMLSLVRHFGDREDDGRKCGLCDVCAPENRVAARFRKPDNREQEIITECIAVLKRTVSLSTGRLFSSACPGSVYPRNDFENLLRAMANAGLIELSEHTFEKGNQTIHYKKAALTAKGFDNNPQKNTSIKIASQSRAQKRGSHRRLVAKPAASPRVIHRPEPDVLKNSPLYDRLRQWRLATAKKFGFPPFRIFGNRVLENLTANPPTNRDELLMISGVGPYLSQHYGDAIIRICKEYLHKK